MKLSALLMPDEYSSSVDPENIEITGIAVSGSALFRGCLFICIRGTRYDSHNLLTLAAKSGAAAAFVEDSTAIATPEGLPLFTVGSTRRAMAYAYHRFYGEPGNAMRLIAVTGTNGKTSTATMLYTILQKAGRKVAMIGTVACKSEEKLYSPDIRTEPRRTMTTPDPDILYPMLADMRKDGVEFVVMETSSHALALEKLAPLRFEIGIFTNLSPEHLDFHGNMENYLAAKARLFSQCNCGIINFDNEYADRLEKQAKCEILRCGAVYHEQYNAEEIVNRGAFGVSYLYSTPTVRMSVSVPIPGSFTVYNSLLALTAAIRLGISPTDAKDALATMPSVPGRLERIPLPETVDFSVFIDYAHTEAALRNILLTVCNFRQGGQRIVLVFGCGGDRDAGKRAPMGRVAEEMADYIIVTSDNNRSEDPTVIIHDILLGMHNRKKRRVIVNRRRAIEYAIQQAQPGDIVLLVGKGHENYELSNGERNPFSERTIVEEAVKARFH